MREILITELVKEVLGPRGGINETIDESPLSEYITGVLIPVSSQQRPDVDSEAEIPYAVTQLYEEDTEQAEIAAPPILNPVLNPKNRPSSMGLSFMIEAEKPKISVCLTWARYEVGKNDAGKMVWRRLPRYAILTISIDSSSIMVTDREGRSISGGTSSGNPAVKLMIDEGGRLTENLQHVEVAFYAIARNRGNNHYFISLYLVNEIDPGEKKKPRSWNCIFQPQIRVHIYEGKLESLRGIPRGKEEQKLEFLYRERRALARGHLCSAVWKEIDPERPSPEGVELDFPQCRNEPPFAWLDGQLLPQQERELFSPPDVRTEFIPIYSIPFPILEWPDEYGDPPELNARKLAETWNPQDLRNALVPLTSAYKKWIGSIEQKAIGFQGREKTIARKLVDECKTVLRRIELGIDTICNDEEARLAFCFANKAINTQWRWKSRGKDFTWRPFQLAFILMTIESIVNAQSEYRDVCDLLWVPTGAGKTEAYLAIIAFTIAHRRRKARSGKTEKTGAGVSIITRYTLRLLTIQQFRRILSLITACEYLRVYNLLERRTVGWRPDSCTISDTFLWGSAPFTIGLWVGGGVTPNRLSDGWSGRDKIPGALSILKGEKGESEPAQVLNCPACNRILAIPNMGLPPGKHTLHFIIESDSLDSDVLSILNGQNIGRATIENATLSHHNSTGFHTLTIQLDAQSNLRPHDVDNMWSSITKILSKNGYTVNLVPARACRPGYFIRYYRGSRGRKVEYDFEIFCPNPQCPLGTPWVGGAPTGWVHGRTPSRGPPEERQIPLFMDGNCLIDIQEPFRHEGRSHVSDRIPIPALTVDEQVYRRLPAVVVATVDKFARPPFEPKASSLFGNVNHHHCIFGYYRQHQPVSPSCTPDGHPRPAGRTLSYHMQVIAPEPPDLIIQDELHLIDGPLGSLVGIYEAAVDFLCSEGRDHPVKYIASTATVRRAEEQVKAVFLRRLQQFPPHGLRAGERFFITEREIHPLDEEPPGRLYAGICAPGRGALTPIVRIYARLLQEVWKNRGHPDIDFFWTLTGYFNAIRELAGARALYRQDIPQRLRRISSNPRQIQDEKSYELSSRVPSVDLPSILSILNRTCPDAPDMLFTTSMFGTGVDIPRIGLMVVNGQPKTTSSYIQSTGRVGRTRGALVVTFLRASRPRDLSHYELFIGYHRMLHRYVEPVTVYPFSPGTIKRALGPVSVFILRNMRSATVEWHREDTASLMADDNVTRKTVEQLSPIIRWREEEQPSRRKIAGIDIGRLVEEKIFSWKQKAVTNRPNLRYAEYALSTPPEHPVVLGDYQHEHAKLDVVYDNVPSSLRDIEETTGFQTR